MTIFLGFIALGHAVAGRHRRNEHHAGDGLGATREIGLRKALGATRGRILVDFLAEGCVLAFISGVIGWSVAFGVSSALKLAQMPEMFPGLPVSGITTAFAFGTLALIAIVPPCFPPRAPRR